MDLINILDERISELINNGYPRDAIKEGKQLLSHLLVVLSSIHYDRFGESEKSLQLIEPLADILKDAAVYSNLTFLLSSFGRFEEAAIYAEKGCNLPDVTADLFYNKGVVLKNLGRLREAVESFRKAIEIDDSPITHCQLSDVLFALGEFREAIQEEQWRFIAFHKINRLVKKYDKPFWDGEDLSGKSILVFNEGGIGDLIQYSRYIPNLYPGRVILDVPDSVKPLFDYDFEGEYDYIVSVLSLPLFFDPNLDDIPFNYNFNIPEFERNSFKFKVGIVWAGSPNHDNDRNRSCFLRDFEVLEMSGVDFYSLQKGPMIRSWPLVNNRMVQGNDNFETVNLMEGSNFLYNDFSTLDTFYDTACCIKGLDLVITVDTVVAHLAGAMGKPVWLLLPWSHDWRWQKQWYPTMKIFREKNWQETFEKVRKELCLTIS